MTLCSPEVSDWWINNGSSTTENWGGPGAGRVATVLRSSSTETVELMPALPATTT